MGIFRTFIAGAVRDMSDDQHWEGELRQVYRPMEIKRRAAERIHAVEAALKADPELDAIYKRLKVTNPPR